MLMPMRKFIARHEDKSVNSSSSSDTNDHESLGADQKWYLRHKHRLTTRVHRVRYHNIEGGSLHSKINLPASTRPSGRITFQCKFILLSQ